MSATPGARERIAKLALKLHLGLLVVVGGGLVQWLLPQPSPARMVGAALLLVPALLPLHGVWRQQRRTFAWGTLCLIPYIIVGIVEMIANAANRSWATGCLLLAFGAFVAFIAYLRVSRPEPSA